MPCFAPFLSYAVWCLAFRRQKAARLPKSKIKQAFRFRLRPKILLKPLMLPAAHLMMPKANQKPKARKTAKIRAQNQKQHQQRLVLKRKQQKNQGIRPALRRKTIIKSKQKSRKKKKSPFLFQFPAKTLLLTAAKMHRKADISYALRNTQAKTESLFLMCLRQSVKATV